MRRWSVIYRRGGKENFKWIETVAYGSKEQALETKREIVKMGYKAHIVDTDKLNKIGLPKSYE